MRLTTLCIDGWGLGECEPQAPALDQGLSFRDEALFEGNVGPDTLLWGKPPNAVSQLFFLTEKCDFICSFQNTYGNGVFFSVGCYFIS